MRYTGVPMRFYVSLFVRFRFYIALVTIEKKSDKSNFKTPSHGYVTQNESKRLVSPVQAVAVIRNS